MKTKCLILMALFLGLMIVSKAAADLVRFDFSGNLAKSFGTVSEGTPFYGYVIYDTDTEGIWVANNPGIPIDEPDNGWEKRQYAFDEFSVTVDGETFSMNGHPPTDRSANPYGTIYITKFPDPNVDQFFVNIGPLYTGFGNVDDGIPNYIWQLGGKDVRQIQMSFSSVTLFADTGPYLLDAEIMQEKFDESTRAVFSLIAPDYYNVSSPLKEGTASPVPVPGSLSLLGAGLICLGGIFRRKRK